MESGSFNSKIVLADGSVVTDRCPDLSPIQKELLLNIAQEGDIDLYGAAKRLGRSTSTIQGAMKRLSQEILIKESHREKSKRGVTDKKVYTLTPRGYFATVLLLEEKLPAQWPFSGCDHGTSFDAQREFLKGAFQIYQKHPNFNSEILDILPNLVEDLKPINEEHVRLISDNLVFCSRSGILVSGCGWEEIGDITSSLPTEGSFRSFDARFIGRMANGCDQEVVAVLKKYPLVWAKVQANLKQYVDSMQKRIDRMREILESEE